MARVIRPEGRIVRRATQSSIEHATARVASAREEAEALVDEARREAARIRDDARAEGHADARREVAELLIAAQLDRRRAVFEAERTIVGLVAEVAQRVLHGVLDDAPERIVPMVRAQLDRVRRARRITLRVCPLDTPALRGLNAVDAALELVEDASLTRGSVVVETDLGTIDARVEVQLDALQRALDEAVARQGTS